MYTNKTIKEMKKYFLIDSERTNRPVQETHYYQWLTSQNKMDIHMGKTKVEYLESKGFILGTHFLSEEDIITLRHIETMFFDIKIKPLLD